MWWESTKTRSPHFWKGASDFTRRICKCSIRWRFWGRCQTESHTWRNRNTSQQQRYKSLWRRLLVDSSILCFAYHNLSWSSLNRRKDWESVARILLYGLRKNFFPIYLSLLFIKYTLFGEEMVETTTLHSTIRFPSFFQMTRMSWLKKSRWVNHLVWPKSEISYTQLSRIG